MGDDSKMAVGKSKKGQMRDGRDSEGIRDHQQTTTNTTVMESTG